MNPDRSAITALHPELWLELSTARRGGRVAHAWLFAGATGLGQRALAEAFRDALLCRETDPGSAHACGRCRSCVLLQAGTHPDALTVTPPPDKRTIGIDAVRELSERLALRPQHAAYQVVLLDPVEALTSAAANALLKTLEEPSAGSVLLLVSTQLERLLPTVRSRCQVRILRHPPPARAAAWLKAQQPTVEPAAIDAALAAHGGAPLAALEALRCGTDGDWVQLRTDVDAYRAGRLPLPQLVARWRGRSDWVLARLPALLADRGFYPDDRRRVAALRLLQSRRRWLGSGIRSESLLSECFATLRCNPGRPAGGTIAVTA
jgi:DNA polymerase-3 subunit delta'